MSTKTITNRSKNKLPNKQRHPSVRQQLSRNFQLEITLLKKQKPIFHHFPKLFPAKMTTSNRKAATDKLSQPRGRPLSQSIPPCPPTASKESAKKAPPTSTNQQQIWVGPQFQIAGNHRLGLFCPAVTNDQQC